MKRIYLLMLLCLAVSFNTFARSSNLTIIARYDSCYNTAGKFVPITAGYKFLYDAAGGATAKHRFLWSVKNLGPDTLAGSDTIWVKTAFGEFWGTFNLNGGKGWKMGDTAVAATNVIELKPNSSITASKTDNNVNWCDSVFVTGTAANPNSDPTASDNRTCATVTITWWVTGINTVTGEKDGFILYPNPAKDKMNIKFDFGKGANPVVLMRDFTGKVVMQRELGKNVVGMQEFTLDISSLTPGMYTAEMMYNDQRIVSKITVQ